MNREIFDFKIGADPEFCGVNDKMVVVAMDYCDDNDDSPWKDQLGCDGCETVFEVRPNPAENPLEVVANIHKALATQDLNSRHNDILNLKWVAGGHYSKYSLGGHIHFGIAKIDPNYYDNLLIKYIPKLDNYLGPITVLLEHKKRGLRRREDGYGKASDYREQSHGFEYRVPSSWLVSPHIAAAILCLSKTIMFEIINNSNFKFKNIVNKKWINKMETDEIRKVFPVIWADIRKMFLYKKYKKYLVENNLSWVPACGMKEAWGFADFSKHVSNKPVKMEKIWKKYSLLIDRGSVDRGASQLVAA